MSGQVPGSGWAGRARTEEEARGIGAAHHDFGQGGLQRASCLLTERRQCLHFYSALGKCTLSLVPQAQTSSRGLPPSPAVIVSLFCVLQGETSQGAVNAVTPSFFTPFPEVSFLLYADSLQFQRKLKMRAPAQAEVLV